MITGSILLDVLAVLAIWWYVAGAILWLPIGKWIKKYGKEQEDDVTE